MGYTLQEVVEMIKGAKDEVLVDARRGEHRFVFEASCATDVNVVTYVPETGVWFYGYRDCGMPFLKETEDEQDVLEFLRKERVGVAHTIRYAMERFVGGEKVHEEIMRPGEFAKMYGVHVKTLQRWDRDGTLKAYRTPKDRRYYTLDHVYACTYLK